MHSSTNQQCVWLPGHTVPIFFFLNDTATTEISPLPLHDALPIFPKYPVRHEESVCNSRATHSRRLRRSSFRSEGVRSEEHTSELQSHLNLVCRLLLEKKKTNTFWR